MSSGVSPVCLAIRASIFGPSLLCRGRRMCRNRVADGSTLRESLFEKQLSSQFAAEREVPSLLWCQTNGSSRLFKDTNGRRNLSGRFHVLCYSVKSDSVGFSLSFLHCSSVCHRSRDFGNLGNPPTINFTFDLKVKSHVSTPCLLWWFTVRHGFIDVMMRHARFGCTITQVMSSIRYSIAANKTFLGSFATLPRTSS